MAVVMATADGYHSNQWATRVPSPNLTPSRTSAKRSISRPKSTPVTLHSSQRTTESRESDHRPQTALGMSRSESTVKSLQTPKTLQNCCDRVFKEPTRKHNLESHLPLKKTKPPPWQAKLDGTPSACVVTPGYMLSRSKSKLHMYIKTDDFFNPDTDSAKQNKRSEPERDALVTQLQQQIDDLTLYLEEERLNHRETKRKADDLVRDKLEEMRNNHSNHVKQLEDEHRKEMEKSRQRHERELSEHINEADSSVAKMRGEVEFLQGAFDSYKSQLNQDMEDKWSKQEDDLRIQHEEEMQKEIHELKTRLIAERASEKADMAKEHQRDIQQLRKEHKKELDALIRRFSNVAADLEKLKETEEKLAILEVEHEELRVQYDEVCSQLTETTRDLTNSKVQLVSFEANFQEKVQEVEEKYQDRIHELMSQNTELRRLYMKKCGELYDEKALMDQTRSDQLSSAKSAMKKKSRKMLPLRKYESYHEGESDLKKEMRKRVMVQRFVYKTKLEKQNKQQTKPRPSSTPGTKHSLI